MKSNLKKKIMTDVGVSLPPPHNESEEGRCALLEGECEKCWQEFGDDADNSPLIRPLPSCAVRVRAYACVCVRVAALGGKKKKKNFGGETRTRHLSSRMFPRVDAKTCLDSGACVLGFSENETFDRFESVDKRTRAESAPYRPRVLLLRLC